MNIDSPEVRQAQERLARSRQALLEHLRGDDEPPSSRSPADTGVVSNLLSRTPYGEVIRSLAQRWWRRHPANAVSQLARPVLERFAREQPGKLVATAAGVGALVFLVKPWRLLSIATLIAAVLKTSDIADMVTTLVKAPHSK